MQTMSSPNRWKPTTWCSRTCLAANTYRSVLLFSRNIGHVTLIIIYLHHLKNICAGSKYPKHELFNFDKRSNSTGVVSPIPRSTVRLANVLTKAFSSTDLRRDAEHNREQTVCRSVCKSKVLQMQPSEEA